MVKRVNVNKSGKSLNVWALGDFHIGNSCFNEAGLKKIIGMIKRDKNAIAFLMGDYAECINWSDKRFDLNNIDEINNTVEKQYLKVKLLLEPIKDKIKGMLMGNHENTIYKVSGINLVRLLCSDLGIPYLGDVGLAKVKVVNHEYKVLLFHGSGSSGTIGGQVNKLVRYASNMEEHPDMTFVGHFHRLDSLAQTKLDTNFKRKTKYMGLTGGFLDAYSGDDNYVTKSFMHPATIGCLMYELDDKGNIKDNKVII